jgi:hypothetical protein
MFLHAKFVVENLYALPTRAELLEGIRHDKFPTGLKGV